MFLSNVFPFISLPHECDRWVGWLVGWSVGSIEWLNVLLPHTSASHTSVSPFATSKEVENRL